jgi:hypothetical protein
MFGQDMQPRPVERRKGPEEQILSSHVVLSPPILFLSMKYQPPKRVGDCQEKFIALLNLYV